MTLSPQSANKSLFPYFLGTSSTSPKLIFPIPIVLSSLFTLRTRINRTRPPRGFLRVNRLKPISSVWHSASEPSHKTYSEVSTFCVYFCYTAIPWQITTDENATENSWLRLQDQAGLFSTQVNDHKDWTLQKTSSQFTGRNPIIHWQDHFSSVFAQWADLSLTASRCINHSYYQTSTGTTRNFPCLFHINDAAVEKNMKFT